MRVYKCFLLLPLLWALGASGPAAAPPTGIYSDPANGFTMSVPSWGEIKQERVVVTIFQAVPEADGYTPNVTVGIDPVKTSLEDYVKDTSDTMGKTNPKATIRSVRKLTVSGREAEILDYDASMAGRRVRFWQLFVVAEDRVYVVTCVAPVETFTKYQAQFEKCITSFSLTR